MSAAYRFLHGLACIVSLSCAASPSVKHIVLVVADDLGWNDIAFGRPGADVITPHLDALAKKSARLTAYYTHEVCSPTRGAILTGRFAYRLGFQGVISSAQEMGLDPAVPTLPEILHRTGMPWRTHAVGKWHCGLFSPSLLPTARGFDSFFGYLDGAESYTMHGNTMGFCGSKAPFGRDLWNGTVPASLSYKGKYSTEMYSARLRQIVEQHDPAMSLFLYAAFQNVHEPIFAPQRFQDMYTGRTNSSSRAMFAADVSALDEGVQNLTDALIARGMWNDTLFIFTTDNGANLHGGGNNWPLRGGKWSLWEGGIRGNSFVHATAIAGHMVGNNSVLSHAADWLPTILGAVGLNASAYAPGIDGVNLWPDLIGTPGVRNVSREIVHKMGIHDNWKFSATLRVGHLKLHVGFPGDDKGAKPCTGGCYCPLPDPATGVRTCVRHPPGVLATTNISSRKDPPSPACAAACKAVSPSCTLASGPHECAECLLPHAATLHAAGCRVPPKGKDLRHWCNAQYHPAPSPAPPAPAPSPQPSELPCSKTPCLFNITADPLEQHDLASSLPDVLARMVARARALQARVVQSRFPGGKNESGACAALERTGMWGPWVAA